MSFAITGMGRSGTKWLARELNRSKLYTVAHEPRGDLQSRFRGKTNYGEVNSRLRWETDLDELNLHFRGVIIRDPFDCARSAHNRGHVFNAEMWGASYRVLDRLLTSNWTPINFLQLVSSKGYLFALSRACGVDDIQSESYDMTPLNSSTPATNDIPLGTLDMLEEEIGWFRKKYRWGMTL